MEDDKIRSNAKRHISFELKRVSHMIKRCAINSSVHRQAERLTGMHGWIIGYLYDNRDREIYQRDVEEKFNIRRSSVSSVLGLMEQNGLIVRKTADHDARLKRIVLTDKAVELHEMVEQDIDELENALSEGITEDELNTFYNVLDKIKSNLEKREGDVQ